MAIKKPHLQQNTFRKFVEKAREETPLEKEVFMVSLRQLDRSQGQSFEQWQEEKILSDALHTLYNYSHQPLIPQLNDKFKMYKGFPPPDKTDFKYPKHVSPDAEWASMHITGKVCLIGHVFKNTFFWVFLDGNHSFWKSELKS